MKKLFIVMALLIGFIHVNVEAAPFVVCDPQAGVTEYRVTGPAWVSPAVPAEADGSIKMDVSAAAIGENSLMVQACNVDAVWGVQCSISSPFVFTRPATPAQPAGLKLNP